MRRLTLSCYLIAFIYCTGIAQNFLSEAKQWHISSAPSASSDQKITLFKVGEDTMLQQITYKRILYATDPTHPNWQPTDILLREDGQKVYQYQASGGDLILYDFDLQIGDIIRYPNCQIEVVKIDSMITADGITRKRWTLRRKPFDKPFYYWIEGIGSTSSLFNHWKISFPNNYQIQLRSFLENEVKIYPENKVINKSLHNQPKVALQPTAKVYPNPTNGLLTIEPNFPKGKKLRYKISNTLGQQVVESFERGVGKFTINISGLKKGFYFLEIQSENGEQITQKIERH